MTRVFVCPVHWCRQPITKILARLQDRHLMSFQPGEDLVPIGFYTEDSGDWIQLVPPGAAFINADDLIDVKLHPDAERLVGCCGPGAAFGPNLVCLRGHEIGMLYADCLTSRGVQLLAETDETPPRA